MSSATGARKARTATATATATTAATTATATAATAAPAAASGAEPSASSTARVGDRVAPAFSLPRLISIEFPGRFRDKKNYDEAIASVGGLGAIRQTLAHPKHQLRFRPTRGYKFQTPMPMERRRTRDVLVRAKRKADGTWTSQPIGVVEEAFLPTTLVDFISAPNESLEYGGSPVCGSFDRELMGAIPPGEPYVPVAYFTRNDTPRLYGFQKNPWKAPNDNEVVTVPGTAEGALKRKWLPIKMVKFTDKGPVPDEAPYGAEDLVNEEDRLVLQRARILFEERPVWLKGLLQEELQKQRLTPNVRVMQEVLRTVAYHWSDGPWRSAYVRLGYDPRKQENADEAMKLQVIDFRDRFFRDRANFYNAVASKSGSAGNQRIGGVPAVDYHFRHAPTNKSQLFQFIDIEDDMVQDIVESAERLDEPDERTGWFHVQDVNAIRDRMMKKSALMRRFTEAPRERLTGPASSGQLSLMDRAPHASGDVVGKKQSGFHRKPTKAASSKGTTAARAVEEEDQEQFEDEAAEFEEGDEDEENQEEAEEEEEEEEEEEVELEDRTPGQGATRGTLSEVRQNSAKLVQSGNPPEPTEPGASTLPPAKRRRRVLVDDDEDD